VTSTLDSEKKERDGGNTSNTPRLHWSLRLHPGRVENDFFVVFFNFFEGKRGRMERTKTMSTKIQLLEQEGKPEFVFCFFRKQRRKNSFFVNGTNRTNGALRLMNLKRLGQQKITHRKILNERQAADRHAEFETNIT
jgi:hypothetical protein